MNYLKKTTPFDDMNLMSLMYPKRCHQKKLYTYTHRPLNVVEF